MVSLNTYVYVVENTNKLNSFEKFYANVAIFKF